jgi:hypothetical protein
VPLAEHDDPYFNDFLLAFARIRGHRERQAVAVPDKPVAWHVGNIDGTMNRLGAIYQREESAIKHIEGYGGELVAKVIPLYVAPPADTVKQEAVIPEGWKLVPIEPTEAMLDDGQEALARVIDPTFEDVLSAYKAMLSAAPDCPHPIVEELTK